jgi:hypothetical protein
MINIIPKILIVYHLWDLAFTQEETKHMAQRYNVMQNEYTFDISKIDIILDFFSLLKEMCIDIKLDLTTRLSIMFRTVTQTYICMDRYSYQCQSNLTLIIDYALQNNIILNEKILREGLSDRNNFAIHETIRYCVDNYMTEMMDKESMT